MKCHSVPCNTDCWCVGPVTLLKLGAKQDCGHERLSELQEGEKAAAASAWSLHLDYLPQANVLLLFRLERATQGEIQRHSPEK